MHEITYSDVRSLCETIYQPLLDVVEIYESWFFIFFCAVESPWRSSTVFWWIVLKCKKCFSASASIHLLTWAIYIPSITESAKTTCAAVFKSGKTRRYLKWGDQKKKNLGRRKKEISKRDTNISVCSSGSAACITARQHRWLSVLEQDE